MQNGPAIRKPLGLWFPPQSSRKPTSFWQEARVSSLVLSSGLDSADAAEIDIAYSRWAPSRGGVDSVDAAEIDMVADSRCAPSRGGLESADAADLEEESVPLASSLERRCNPFSIQ